MGKVFEKILHVGASPERVAEIISSHAVAGGKSVKRVFAADGGTSLVSVLATETKEVMDRLLKEFGADRIIDASQVRPEEVRRF